MRKNECVIKKAPQKFLLTFFVLPDERSFWLNFKNRRAKTHALATLAKARRIFMFVTFWLTVDPTQPNDMQSEKRYVRVWGSSVSKLKCSR